MERQYSSKYKPIPLFGCYFITLGAWAEEISKKRLTSKQVLEVYVKAVTGGYMNVHCFILNPDVITNYFLHALGEDVIVQYIGWWNSDQGTTFLPGFEKEDISFEVLRYKTPTGYHFRSAGFDPGPRFERSPDINGKRYFKVVR